MSDLKQQQIEAAWAEWEAKYNPRAHLTHELRLRLAEAQNWRCCWAMWGCTTRMEPTKSQPDSATFEHIIPIALGGTHDIANIAISCARCNQRRGKSVSRFTPAGVP
jgi:hypothetical protein